MLSPKLSLKPGDHVLVGSAYCPPGDWFFATVLWSDGEEVLTEHTTPSMRDRCRQVLGIDRIRAVGAYEQLHELRERMRTALHGLSDNVRHCESMLERARDELRNAIDDLATAEPILCPADEREAA